MTVNGEVAGNCDGSRSYCANVQIASHTWL